MLLSSVWGMYIYLYTRRTPVFPAPRGALAHTQNRATGERTQAARAGGDRPAPALILYEDMDKTELSAIDEQTSRAETANPHSSVSRMSHNIDLLTFAANLSAIRGHLPYNTILPICQ